MSCTLKRCWTSECRLSRPTRSSMLLARFLFFYHSFFLLLFLLFVSRNIIAICSPRAPLPCLECLCVGMHGWQGKQRVASSLRV